MRPFNIFVPNLLNVCIDEYTEEEMKGRIYHCYSAEEILFGNVIDIIKEAEKVFDAISFPQASTKSRTFSDKEVERQTCLTKKMDQRQVATYKGEKGTFLISVRFRQNATWQGDFRHEESGDVRSFVDVVELMKQMEQLIKE